MTTFQSLFNHLSLKTLITSLQSTRQCSPLPFFVLKFANRTPYLPEYSSLAISRNISDETLTQFQGPLSIWSPQHLQRISETRDNIDQDRIILKNPYKCVELMSSAVKMGVRQMVIDSVEEYHKTESFVRKYPNFKNKGISYYWKIDDSLQNLNELSILKNHVRGLFFGVEQTSQISKVEQITHNVLKSGINIQNIICEGKMGKLEPLNEWKREQLSWKGTSIEKTVDVCEVSEVENYFLATRTLCKRRNMIHQQARELLGGLQCSKNSLLVDHQNERWLLSAISTLPLEQEKYLFNVQTANQTIHLDRSQAFAI